MNRSKKHLASQSLGLGKMPFCLGLVVLAAPVIVPAADSSSNTATSQSRDQRHHFMISKQPLYSALNAIAEQGGVQFVYTDDMVKGLLAPFVSGQLSTVEALHQVLAGSGLGYRVRSGNTITLAANAVETQPVKTDSDAKGELTTLPAVTVSGEAVYAEDNANDDNNPYNPKYYQSKTATGTKTDTPLMETPVNIQVISKAVLNDQQAITLSQALKNVAGVTTGGFGGQLSDDITLRGFQTSIQFRNGFRINKDFNAVGTRQFANVERIEVLKGPAAILYGRVEPGGMVNVVTKQPLATPYYALQQQFGSFDLFRTTLDATGPLTKDDTLLYRMNMSYENSGSFRDLVDNERFFIAPILKWNISPRTQATLEMEYNHDNLNYDYQALPFLNGKFVDIPSSRNLLERSPKQVDTVFVGFNWSHQFNDDWTINQRFATYQVDQQPSPTIDGRKTVGSQLSRGVFTFDKQTEDYYTTLDLTGHFDTAGLKHTLLVGGDYYRRDISSIYTDPAGTIAPIDIYNPVHGAPVILDPNAQKSVSSSTTDNYGVYLQDQIKLPYNIHVMGGLRYQNVQTLNNLTKTTTTDDAVTPRVGVLWQPQNWLSVYGNYVENFGAGNGQGFGGNQLPPESAQQWETGIKTEFFDGRLSATLAYFDLTKQNVGAPDTVPGHENFAVAIGEVRSRGPEFDIRGEILPGWNVIATYANLDTRITKSTFDGEEGSRLFAVPRNMGSVWNTYDFQKGSLKGLKVGGGVTMRDSTTDFNNSIDVAGYTTVDLLAAYSLKVGKSRVTAQLNVNNLLDKDYLVNGFHFGTNGQVVYGTPRSFMGSIKVEF